ncbi:MAG: GNAT family N-acetyltransferase [Solirubrobacteraceae bacterium]|nr:GNAT family N-acetyltransferase [Solirubrobacteraceae bacterium]
MRVDYPDPPLGDHTLQLREWELGDVPCIQAASADPRIGRGTTVPSTHDHGEAVAFIERQWSRQPAGEGISLAVVEQGTAIGLVHLGSRPQPAVLGLGYWLVPAARGRGLGAHAVRLISDWALRDTEAERIEAWVEPDNPASAATLTRVGYVHEGLLRNFLVLGGERSDVLVYSKLRRDA